MTPFWQHGLDLIVGLYISVEWVLVDLAGKYSFDFYFSRERFC